MTNPQQQPTHPISPVYPPQRKVQLTSPTLAHLVREAYIRGYSDLHLGVGEVPRFRNQGAIETTDYPVINEATFLGWLKEILEDEDIRKFQDTLDFDGAGEYNFARVRINIFDALGGPSMVLRLVPKKILTLDELGMPPVLKNICRYHKGLVLLTGPTGSGKSTTMAAMVDYINREMPKNIISIEDPIEFVHTSQKSLVKQRQVGMHTLQFDAALRASLREDPDVILIGELRDRETVNLALRAAQTGHVVFGTLHTSSAVQTIGRILSLYSPGEQDSVRVQVTESLVAVISQALVQARDGRRVAIHEIMINTDTIRDYISRGDLGEIEALISQSTYDGMCTMNQSLHNLYVEGHILEETALEASPKPNEMAQVLRGRV